MSRAALHSSVAPFSAFYAFLASCGGCCEAACRSPTLQEWGVDVDVDVRTQNFEILQPKVVLEISRRTIGSALLRSILASP